MKLKLAETLSLPVDVATQTLLVVGKRGSGKSNTCVRLAEGLFRAGVPFVAVDPVDNWHGIKSSKDGKSAGLGVYVFGGARADAPLESVGGGLIADVLIEHRISAVLSIKHFSGRERARFVSDLAERLFQKNRDPLHVFLEEAHEVAPQNPMKGEEEMVGRINRLVKLGRSSGVGVSAITQRPASLSKNVTTQAEILVVHRTIGPQDVAAVREWIKYHGDREDMLGELATLHDGEAFVWAPDFPKGAPIGLKRVRMLMRETFDSAATPKAGERRSEPKAFAPVDLDALTKRMSATIEKAKADDPKALRARIAELERQMKTAQAAPQIERVEVPVLDPALVRDMQRLGGELSGTAVKLVEAAEVLSATCARAHAPMPAANTAAVAADNGRGYHSSPRSRPAAAVAVPPRERDDDDSLTGPERKLLTALVQHGRMSKIKLALLTNYSHQGGGFRNPLGALRSRGLIDYMGEDVEATSEGLICLGSYEPLPTGRALLEQWLGQLPGPEAKILRCLADVYPRALDVQELATRAGYDANGGGFRNPLGRLRTLELVSRGREVRASDALFQ